MQQNTVILFMAHYLNDAIVKQLESLRECCSSRFTVVLLYDNSRNDFDASRFGDRSQYYLYNWKDVSSTYASAQQQLRSVVPGNCIFPILKFAGEGPDSQFVWRIEYDVRFTGDWNALFQYFDKNDADLLTTTIFRYDFRPEWVWWKSLKSPLGRVETKALLRGFLPVFRLSRKACGILDGAYRGGWTGHYEVSIPTILNLNDCSIEDIGGDGEFVKPQNKNRFYTNSPSSPGLAPGTFVCPPNLSTYPESPNMLYHPVKDGY